MVKDILKRVLLIAAVVFVMLQIIAITCIDWFMFHPGMVTEKYDASSEGYVNIGTEEEPIAAVVLGPERGKKVILRCHGNAESMYQSIAVLRDLVRRGYTVACVDYPGYGLSVGKPSEEGCYRNVHRLYEYLVEKRGFSPDDIIIDGFSIGTGPACELAATKDCGGLVLEAPFLSAPRVVTKVRLLAVDSFPNEGRIAWGIGCPMLILHGTDDTVVPFSQGEELYRQSRLRSRYPCRFIPVEGADHTEIPFVLGGDGYLKLIADFAENEAVEGPAVNVDYATYHHNDWRQHIPPHLAGVVFALVLAVLLLVFAYFRRCRKAREFRSSCKETMDRLQGVHIEQHSPKHEKIDKPIHVEANTMPLGLKKLVKTGSPYDKGVMG